MLVYEYPFNETVRSILRLEYLFQRLEVFLQSDNPEHHLTAISLMFDIGDVTSRADLKSSLLKELERQRALLASFRTEASVNSAALELTINDLENCLSKLNQLVGRPNTLINESEWLAIIRSRLSVPGGTSPVDIPSFYCWQQLPAKQRREQLIAYTPAFVDWQTTCNLYLKLLRQAGEAQGVFSESGSFQQMLSGRTYQLIRVGIEEQDLIPEISANKYMLWIRFLQNSTTGKPVAITHSLNFHLTLCNL